MKTVRLAWDDLRLVIASLLGLWKKRGCVSFGVSEIILNKYGRWVGIGA